MSKKKKLKSILAVLLSVCAFVAFLLSPLFNFKSVEVVGEHFYSEEELKGAVSHLNDRNYFILLFENTPFSHLDYMFQGRLYDCEKKILTENPYLKTVEISFSFPMKAVVSVTERTPVFLTKHGGEYLLVDSEGVVVDTFSEENKPDYPVIEGIETLDCKVGSSLVGKGTDMQLELAMKICSGMKQVGIAQNSGFVVDVSDTDRIWMFVQPSLSVCFGDDTDLNVKLSVLKEIFDKGYNGDSDGVIDFTNGKNPIFKKNDSVGLPQESVEESQDVSGQGESVSEDVLINENVVNGE